MLITKKVGREFDRLFFLSFGDAAGKHDFILKCQELYLKQHRTTEVFQCLAHSNQLLVAYQHDLVLGGPGFDLPGGGKHLYV
mmetsp:Transcript_920/g.1352  ORF Transcript_920/g.1352 Transcript_920/m.1352 type:complete len:82 (+) Transcript_920:169-414(+)